MLFTLGRLHVISLSRHGSTRILACQSPSSSLLLPCSSSLPSSTSSSPLCGYYSTTVVVHKNSYSRIPEKQFNREQGPSGNKRTSKIGASGQATLGARNRKTDPLQRSSTEMSAVGGRQARTGAIGNHQSSRNKSYSPTKRRTTTTKLRGMLPKIDNNSKDGTVFGGIGNTKSSRSNEYSPMRRTPPRRGLSPKRDDDYGSSGSSSSMGRSRSRSRFGVMGKFNSSRSGNDYSPTRNTTTTKGRGLSMDDKYTSKKGNNSQWDDNSFSRRQGAVTAVGRRNKIGGISSPLSTKNAEDRGSNHRSSMLALDSTRRDTRTLPTRATRGKKQLMRPSKEHTLDSTKMASTTHRKRTRTSVDPLDVPTTNMSKTTIRPKSKKLTTFPRDRWEIVVTCLPGLESILSNELHALQIDHTVISCGAKLHSSSPTTTTTTATTMTTTVDTLMKCHLCLGSASHIYLQCLDTFKARGLAELRRKISLIPWDSILLPTVTFQPIRVTVTKSKLYHTRAIEDRVINGIYEALGLDVPEYSSNDDEEDNGVESTMDFEAPKKTQRLLLNDKDKSLHTSARGNIGNDDTNAIRLDVRLDRDEVSISIDTSLTPLHRRGYRLETAKAPLREDLAFALLYCAGWRPSYGTTNKDKETNNRYSGLLDAFCGSGTIAIEGAAMAAGLPPGRLRPAPLTGTLFYNSKRWNALVKEASDQSKNNTLYKDAMIVVAASDRDEGAVDAAQSNAVRAGVLSWMNIQCLAFSSHPWLDGKKGSQPPPQKLLVASNLPFGKRISPNSGKNVATSDKPLLHLYQTLGHRVNRLLNSGSDVRAVFLGDDPKLMRRTDIKTGFNVGFKSQHGGMSVTALVTRENSNSP
jgi:putative N6-adenine-specific DNA methylase